jgi:hypothetical protein
MKRQILLSIFLVLCTLVAAQTGPVEEMFNKYSDKEGFTVVTISSRMFSMLSKVDSGNQDADDIIHNLKSIRILSVEDSLLNKNLNFYSELSKKLDLKAYEELMVVKEGKDITKFLVKNNGDRVSELLVITGGPGGNSLISIKGNLSLRNISDLSKNLDMKELDGLEKMKK